MKRKTMQTAVQFWQGNIPPTTDSMFLRNKTSLLDCLERKEIFSYLPPIQGKEILDLPSGIGRYTKEFLQRGAKRVVAADVSPIFLKKCQKRTERFHNISCIEGQATDLSFPLASFDLIFVNWLFLYLSEEEVQQMVEKFFEWLKPDGALFFRETLSPTRENKEGKYTAIYRRYVDYPKFFNASWKKRQEGNIVVYETFFSDPFQGFWIYEKCLSSSA